VRVERESWDGADSLTRARELRRLSPPDPSLEAGVAEIVADVRDRGDAALRELTARFDATEVEAAQLEVRVDRALIERARDEADAGLLGALEVAARNIRSVARAELEAATATHVALAQGQMVNVVDRPVRSAGIYVPGGLAAYPSSVLMGCVPARVAGVDRVAVATPPGADGSVHTATLAACAVAGVNEVYAIGGAQAIAALALGTEAVAPVDVIAGPGNRYVNEAKRLVYGEVAVDGIAGPSELVVVLDATADSRCIALDLLAQAEHGSDGLLVAVAARAGALDALSEQLSQLAPERPTVRDATISLIEAPDLPAAIELADALAPEHLELALEIADERLASDRVAGAVFFGPGGAVAFGDYAAGSNHVLPTGGAARYGGPLGVRVFRRRTSVVELPAQAAAGLAPRVAALARAEGFDVHAESAEARSPR
jgi:histidinol dehydrogenase